MIGMHRYHDRKTFVYIALGVLDCSGIVQLRNSLYQSSRLFIRMKLKRYRLLASS